jgi:hypothetical protein
MGPIVGADRIRLVKPPRKRYSTAVPSSVQGTILAESASWSVYGHGPYFD